MPKHRWADERLDGIDFKACSECGIRYPLAAWHWPAVCASECVAAKDAKNAVKLPDKLEWNPIGMFAELRSFVYAVEHRINTIIDYLKAKEKE